MRSSMSSSPMRLTCVSRFGGDWADSSGPKLTRWTSCNRSSRCSFTDSAMAAGDSMAAPSCLPFFDESPGAGSPTAIGKIGRLWTVSSR